ncbi:hypothetical protein DJ030_01040 [bacterium endosymbiont of Escarpia laminata]|nr:MAG: hypothetical protein DJ031_11015 [bacterium endosymbiont of Escarpia laminata]RLJ22566.1 MAG: hypothetical protein DJ030_01040 [bacterium endosymbiont of Escarpia laminata]
MKFLNGRVPPALLLLVLGFTGYCLAGCQQTTAGTKRVVEHRTVDTSHPNAMLILGSDALVGAVTILDPRLRNVGAFTQGQVTVQNLSDNRLSLEYKFKWEDASGFVVDEDNMWHRFILTPRQVKRFQSTGKSEDASNMVFTVRNPDDIFIEYDRRYKDQEKEN